MYTRCPQCETIFRLDPAQLGLAEGRVRCGRCRAVFDGTAHQVDLPPASGAQAIPETDDRPSHGHPSPRVTEEGAGSPHQGAFRTSPPKASDAKAHRATPDRGDGQPQPPGDGKPETAVSDEAAGKGIGHLALESPDDPLTAGDAPGASPQQRDLAFPGTPSDQPLETDELAGSGLDAVVPGTNRHDGNKGPVGQGDIGTGETGPSADELPFILADGEERPTGGVLATLARFVLSLALVALLAGQYAYVNRDDLARQSDLRPWLEHLCRAVGCTLPPRRDLAAFQVLERDVRFHPRYRKALLISASFVNRAPFPQPYPELEVTLKDMAGRGVARRRFHPREYLGGSHVPAEGLPPQGEAPVLLEVADPGLEAVNFEFAFR